jgi:hypothetical protein
LNSQVRMSRKGDGQHCLPIATYLAGLTYPANRDEILRYAASRGAGAGIGMMLAKLPDNVYCSLGEIVDAYACALW